MTNEELDEATVNEARRRWLSTPALRIHGTLGEDAPFIVARLARENWTPPEPVVDPDVLAFREWAAERWPERTKIIREGRHDFSIEFDAYLAGARMAREQEQERAKVLVEYVETDARRLDGVGGRALAALAKHRGEA